MVGGYSVIDGVALINTPVAKDVRTPVKENYIPRLLTGVALPAAIRTVLPFSSAFGGTLGFSVLIRLL